MPRPSQSSYEAASFQHEGPSSAFQVIASRAEEEDNDFEPIMSPDREPASMRLTKGQLIFGRLASAVLSLFFAAVLVYTIETDGSPFRSGILTPWLSTTIVDYYITGLPFYLWILMRERTWLLGAFWSIACICLGSVLVWGYVFVELMKTQPGTPLITFVMGAAESTGRPSSSGHRLAKKTSKGKSKSKDTDDEQRDEAGAVKH